MVSGLVSNQEDQTNLRAGAYSVAVTDINGCILNRAISLTQPLHLNVTLTPTNITCEAPGFDNGSVDLTIAGGRPPYQFNWSNGRTTEDIVNLTAGIYSVDVTDKYGCMVSASVEVKLPPPLTIGKTILSYNGFGCKLLRYGKRKDRGYTLPVEVLHLHSSGMVQMVLYLPARLLQV